MTQIAVLYVESFGNPRKFAGTARRVAQRMPVLTVIGGRSPAGQRAAASHTAAAATPLATQEALFDQAGVIATTSLGELVDTAALLACQPLPAGNRVAIVVQRGRRGRAGRRRVRRPRPAGRAARRGHPARAAQAAAGRRGGDRAGGHQPRWSRRMPSAPAWRKWPPTTASTRCSRWRCPRRSPT